jgi:hypothetical protein
MFSNQIKLPQITVAVSAMSPVLQIISRVFDDQYR